MNRESDNVNICVPVIRTDKRTAIQDIERATKHGAELIELRIDYLKERSSTDLTKIMSKSKLPVIVTNRNEKNGGCFPSNQEDDRISTLISGISAGASFADVELDSEKKSCEKVIKSARQEDVKVIISFHDFSGTPKLEESTRILMKMERLDADIVKLVPTVNNRNDLKNIVDAALWAGDNLSVQYVIMGMGKMGRLVRIIAPFLGSRIIFASLEEGLESAPTQLGLDEAKILKKLLGSK